MSHLANIFVQGISFRTASVAMRERLAVRLPDPHNMYSQLGGTGGLVFLGTCNRFEWYRSVTTQGAAADITGLLAGWSGVPTDAVSACVYTLLGKDAVEHAFNVAAGLDSQIMGEDQILGQMKTALSKALAMGTPDVVLKRLFQMSICAGKRVRAETGIDRLSLSAAIAAVDLAQQAFGSLQGRKVLVLGAGATGERVVEELSKRGVRSITVSSRSYVRAHALASKYRATAVCFAEFPVHFETADVIVGCTASPHYVVEFERTRTHLEARGGRPVVMIDLAVPRDIDPRLAALPCVRLHNLEDLRGELERSDQVRTRISELARPIIELAVAEFLEWCTQRDLVPAISALNACWKTICERELERGLGRLAGLRHEERDAVAAMTRTLLNRLMHRPIDRLKQYCGTPTGALYTEVLMELFGREEESP